MGLKEKIEHIKDEYETYKNLKESFKLQDGKTTVSIEDLDKSERLNKVGNNVLKNIIERKKILNEIIQYHDKPDFKKREKDLERRLEENDTFFMNVGMDNISEIKGFFEKATENLARTAEWQNYYMAFTTLEGLDLNNIVKEHRAKMYEMQEKRKEVETRRKEGRDVIKKIQKKYPKEDAKDFARNYEADEKNLQDMIEKSNQLEKESEADAKLLQAEKDKLEGYKGDIEKLQEQINKENESLNYLKMGLENMNAYREVMGSNKKESVKKILDEIDADLAAASKKLNEAEPQLETAKQELEQLKKTQENDKKFLTQYAKQHGNKEVSEYIDLGIAMNEMQSDYQEMATLRATLVFRQVTSIWE